MLLDDDRTYYYLVFFGICFASWFSKRVPSRPRNRDISTVLWATAAYGPATLIGQATLSQPAYMVVRHHLGARIWLRDTIRPPSDETSFTKRNQSTIRALCCANATFDVVLIYGVDVALFVNFRLSRGKSGEARPDGFPGEPNFSGIADRSSESFSTIRTPRVPAGFAFYFALDFGRRESGGCDCGKPKRCRDRRY